MGSEQRRAEWTEKIQPALSNSFFTRLVLKVVLVSSGPRTGPKTKAALQTF